MSYGNKWQEINFNVANSLSLITGQSGSGKSTIFNVLEYGLYGKVHNKRLQDLPNRINKNLEVELLLSQNNQEISIYRSIQPNNFKVDFKGNNLADKAGKKNVQEYLEEEIYKIPYNIFNNVISLSITDFESFLKMSPKDKREIIDKIFGLSLINSMQELVKTELKDYKSKENENNIKLNSLSSHIQNTQYHIENLKVEIQEQDDNRMNELIEELDKLKSTREKIVKNIEKCNSKQAEVKTEFDEASNFKYKLSSEINQLKVKENLYKNSKCPECGSDLTSDEHKTKHKELIQKRKKYENKLQ